MKVLVCDAIAEDGVAALKKAGHAVDVKTGLTPEQLNEAIGAYHAVIVRSATKIRKDQIDRALALKVIGRAGVGLDNIDADYAKGKGIKVVNTPAATSISVAELTFAHMLCAARALNQADALMKQGKWEKKKFEGFELFGKTLGLVGCGRIGGEVAKRAAAFGMKVLAYDPYLKDAKGLDLSLVPLDEVLAKSDYLSLHVPLTPETKDIIGTASLGKVKKGVVIVNCARGGTVDEEALAKALEAGTVRYACLDVFSAEPIKGTEAILKAPNACLTPHIGAATHEGQTRAGVEVARVVIEALK